ncbi:MAG: hypothetical protein ACRDJW_24790 [Thermomicrobiales bacterium]
MYRKAIALVMASLLTVGVVAAATAQGRTPTLNFGSELNAAACGGGRPAINVTQKVVNDDDSGVGIAAWAIDNYNRHIQVWELEDGVYCAILQYHGQFISVGGTPGPAGTGTLSAGVTGTIHGGARIIFSGTWKAEPLADTRGHIGTFDYECDGTGFCGNLVDWRTLYFDGLTANSFQWWGWIYHAGNNGTWVNASEGNQGNITD